ncbi:SDR family NAD(P)-dependent oxidoreductase [Halobellus marinus]|jgi:NAD(P)-dependent dehydrogenase (short-subunit alcohol dehydrogenase family)|uniref:SDR family NAD(P)-dependent oxidoreductase n=1 Tax=Halobellus TaxID=1073986 RepID=UPI0028B07DD3|nr:SDR family oxidoreductase [Halobellus sp. DFY28]
MELTDATVVVTGASRGIGRALLSAFAAQGATVVGCARDAEALAAAVSAAESDGDAATESEGDAATESVGGDAADDGSPTVQGVTADVRNEAAVGRLMETADAVGDTDGIDLLVANAGVKLGASGESPIHEEPYDRFDDTLATNLRGVFATAKEAIERMPPEGRILVPSGSIAVDPKPGMGAYAVSKGAVETLVRQLAVDAEQTAAVVDPGLVDTDLSASGGRSPDDVAPMFVWAASEAAGGEIDGERVDLRLWKQATRSR